jgi:hypothetical protein
VLHGSPVTKTRRGRTPQPHYGRTIFGELREREYIRHTAEIECDGIELRKQEVL